MDLERFNGDASRTLTGLPIFGPSPLDSGILPGLYFINAVCARLFWQMKGQSTFLTRYRRETEKLPADSALQQIAGEKCGLTNAWRTKP